MLTQQRTPEYPVDPQFTERWSSRAFTGEPIEESTLLSFFEAARWAPSAYNAQPWRFIYGRAETPAWTPIFDALLPLNQTWAQRASALVVIVSRTQWIPPGKNEAQALGTHGFDTGAAWASLALQAQLAGWHTHAMAGFDQEVLRRNLGIPADYAVHVVVAIGRRGDKSVLPEALQAREQPNDRLPVKALVAEGSFAFEG
ncbi:MAG: nitroreductase family protein [Zoogloea sp.]|nr:nitroreductase family protein [Zoogloea sp.]